MCDRTNPMGWVSMATSGGDQLLQPTTAPATTSTTGGAAINVAVDAALAAATGPTNKMKKTVNTQALGKLWLLLHSYTHVQQLGLQRR